MRTTVLLGFAPPLVSAAAILAFVIDPERADAASFDCAKASTTIERTICTNPSLSAKDAALGKLYVSALRGSSAAEARSEQRLWVTQSQQTCRSVACLEDAYDERLAELFSEATAAQEFRRTDDSGVLQIIAAEGNWIAFSVSATWEGNGEGAVNTGEATGAAPVAGGRFRYVIDDCTLNFAQRNASEWQVSESDGCAGVVGGLNVTMAGVYRAAR
jgi:uncharacterized protein